MNHQQEPRMCKQNNAQNLPWLGMVSNIHPWNFMVMTWEWFIIGFPTLIQPLANLSPIWTIDVIHPGQGTEGSLPDSLGTSGNIPKNPTEGDQLGS